MILINILLDFDSIFYCTQCKKVIDTYSRKVRLCRLCTWRKDKLCLLYTSLYIQQLIILTLMKGDEVVESAKNAHYTVLFLSLIHI